jgi:HTH-type transcriptional regulator/antitoxin HigA
MARPPPWSLRETADSKLRSLRQPRHSMLLTSISQYGNPFLCACSAGRQSGNSPKLTPRPSNPWRTTIKEYGYEYRRKVRHPTNAGRISRDGTEDRPQKIQAAPGKGCAGSHLAEKGLKRSDLWPVIGSKSRVSEIIAGERSISKSQAKRLAAFFHVPVELFI